jgi:DNA-binding transcriptional regulator YiaG
MFVKDAVRPEAKRMNAVMPSESEVQPELCHGTPLLNQDAGVRPVEKGHKVSGKHQISVSPTPVVSKTGNAGRGEVLDRHSLKEALQVLGLSLAEFSVLANTPLDTVKGWSSGKTKTPGIALAMVRLLAQMR